MEGWRIAAVPLRAASRAEIVQVRRDRGFSYVIGSEGEAAVIDPSLDAAAYARLAADRGWAITAVLVTHVRRNQVARAFALGTLTGAHVYLPHGSRVETMFTPIADGETLTIGRAVLAAIASTRAERRLCYLVDQDAVCTGEPVGVPLEAAVRERIRRRDGLTVLPAGP